MSFLPPRRLLIVSNVAFRKTKKLLSLKREREFAVSIAGVETKWTCLGGDLEAML